MNNESLRDAVKQITGVLSALIPLVGVMGLNLDWFNEEFIRQFEVMALAVLSFFYTCWRIWKNHYATQKAQEKLSPVEQAKEGTIT